MATPWRTRLPGPKSAWSERTCPAGPGPSPLCRGTTARVVPRKRNSKKRKSESHACGYANERCRPRQPDPPSARRWITPLYTSTEGSTVHGARTTANLPPTHVEDRVEQRQVVVLQHVPRLDRARQNQKRIIPGSSRRRGDARRASDKGSRGHHQRRYRPQRREHDAW